MTDSAVVLQEPVDEIMDEQTRLAYYESIIERGRQTFVEVGTALMEIREARLYREQGFATFEDYCQERWGWGRMRASQLITAAEVVLELKSGTIVPIPEDDSGDVNHGLQTDGVNTCLQSADLPESMSTVVDIPLPTNERQIRELKKANDPAIRRAAWEFAVAENGPDATAAEVREAVETVVEAVRESPEILTLPTVRTPGEQDRMEALARMAQAHRARTETPGQKEQRLLAVVGDEDGNIARARLRQATSTAVHATYSLWALKPEAIIGVLDEAGRVSIREMIRDGRKWFDDMERLVGRGVHIVKGNTGD